MEDERVSTVASTAPDQSLLRSGNQHRAPAPKYKPPPPYNTIRSGISKSSIDHPGYGGHSDDDYADYDEEEYPTRRSPPHQRLKIGSQDVNDQVYFAHEYTPKRQLESNRGTMRSTTTLNSIRHNDSLNRLYDHGHHTRHCGRHV